MGIAQIIVALMGFGMLVVITACGVAALAVVSELWQDYRGLFVHARKHPRFGIGAIFTLVTIAAAACAMFGGAVMPICRS